MSGRRILFSVCLLVLVLVAPYWIYLPVILVGVVVFPTFVEGIVVALMADALYGHSDGAIFILNFPYALGVAVLVSFAPIIRKRLRFNA